MRGIGGRGVAPGSCRQNGTSTSAAMNIQAITRNTSSNPSASASRPITRAITACAMSCARAPSGVIVAIRCPRLAMTSLAGRA
jgi:hypothetical protein